MTQAVWSTAHGRPARDDARTAARRPSRLASHVDPILAAAAAPLWVVAPEPAHARRRPDRRRRARSASRLLARRAAISASDGGAGMVALAYLVYPWVVWTSIDAMHPLTLAIPSSSLLRLGARRRPARRLRAVRPSLAALTGELMGLDPRRARASGTRSRGDGGGSDWRSPRSGRRGRWSRSTSSCRRSRTVRARTTARFVAVGGSPQGLVRTLFTDPGCARHGPRDERQPGLRLPAGGALRRLLPARSRPRRGGAPAGAREHALRLACLHGSAAALHRGRAPVPARRERARYRAPPSRAEDARCGAVLGMSVLLLAIVGPFSGTDARASLPERALA